MFKHWCEQNSTSGRRSHVTLDGGSYSIPPEIDVLQQYLECIKVREKIYLVEQKTPCFNFFVDLDYKDATELSFEEIQNVCAIVCKKVKSITNSNKECIICVGEPKNVKDQIKTGVHMNWKGLVINKDNALVLRSHIVSELINIRPGYDWDSIVDIAVYKGSGFRLPWSYKKVKHDLCKGKGCNKCFNVGKIDEGFYLPLYSYKNGAFTRLSPEPSIQLLRKLSIRTQDEQSIDIGGGLVTYTVGDIPTFQKDIGDPSLKKSLQKFITKNMIHWPNMSIKSVVEMGNVKWVGTYSQYCENVKREHKSHHIWFLIQHNMWITQKCFCRCIRNDGNKSCKDFSGTVHKLDHSITNMLSTSPPPPPIDKPTMSIDKWYTTF